MVVRLMFEERGPRGEDRPTPGEQRRPDTGGQSVTILPTSPGPPLRLSREDVEKITRAVERNGGGRRDGTHG